ncbi:MAG: sugar ABC transporter substrate-binding protein [Christensenellales bacterium]|jgi:ribose transport system substrate-binding protein
MKKLLVTVLILLMVLVPFTGCAGGGEEVGQDPSNSMGAPVSNESESENAGETRGTFGYIFSSLNNPIFVHMKNVMEDECKTLDINMVYLDSQDDVATELSNMEDMISREVDAIGITCCDAEGSVAALKLANKANIPIITVDRFMEGADITAQLATDNVKGGICAGENAVEGLGQKGNVVILRGLFGLSLEGERYNGFMEVINQYPDIEIVAEQAGDFEREKGFTAMENILQAKDEIDLVYALNDEMAIGACKAIEAAGRQKEGIKVIGYDGSPDGMEYVNNGQMWGLVFQQFDVIGRGAVQTVSNLLDGKEVEKIQAYDVVFCTKENYDELKF